MNGFAALAWGSLAFVGYTYFGYAALLRAWPARRRVKDEHGVGEPSSLPTMSLILAACNEAANIGCKLDNLADLEYPEERVEILIGSDSSTDGTRCV